MGSLRMTAEPSLFTVDGSRTIRIEAYDIAHMSGKNMVGVMTGVKHILKAEQFTDTKELEKLLTGESPF